MHPTHEQSASHKSQPVAARVRRVVVNAVCFVWKALCALLIPPPDALHGYPAFITSILVITLIAALVVELASLFGCVTGVNSFVVAITLLATGTSIPDLIASVVAADHLPTADSAIANINASNCIIVFSGMGIPWLITTLYNQFVLGSANNSVRSMGQPLQHLNRFGAASLTLYRDMNEWSHVAAELTTLRWRKLSLFFFAAAQCEPSVRYDSISSAER
ncbi:unnamed protein product [Closterium sp. Yama58-4]|nr:unnamed protein product [Closterium sp. Yama58-4]